MTAQMMRYRPVILDVDPGIDDSLAILLALRSPELRVEAITVVAGNVDVDQGVENALKIVELAGARDVPVARGAAGPLLGKLTTARHVHGENGLGDIALPPPAMKPYQASAAELMAGKIEEHDGQLTLIPVGPLTNIARLLIHRSEIIPRIKEIVLMGGSFTGGNITPAAEFNIYNDPEAAQIVFESGVPIRMVTLDVTRKTFLHPTYLKNASPDTDAIHRLVFGLNEFYIRTRGGRGIFLHDPLAVGAAIDPSFVFTEVAHVEVETNTGKTRGATTVGRGGIEPNARITVDVEADRFVRFFVDRVLGGSRV